MAETPKQNPIRPTDAEAIEFARKLIDNAGFGAIAINSAAHDHPHISRIQLSTDSDGNFVTLVSELSAHTAPMRQNPNCSLLIGEPGKGDPLAHPRMSIAVIAEEIERGGEDHLRLRESHLAHHPKSALYIDFADFCFFKLHLVSANLNGGFGRAYQLTKEDLAKIGAR